MLAVGHDYRTHVDDTIKDGWVPVNTVSTATLSQYFGVAEETLEFADIFDEGMSIAVIDCIELEEEAPTAAEKADLLLMLFTADPTAPAEDAVYNAVKTNHVATISIVAADYERVSSLTWKARKTDLKIPCTIGLSGVTSLFGVLLSNETGTFAYDASTAIRVRVWAKHQA
jgi:hypothetical protein